MKDEKLLTIISMSRLEHLQLSIELAMRVLALRGRSPRRQRVAVFFDRALRTGREGELLVFQKVNCHDALNIGIWLALMNSS